MATSMSSKVFVGISLKVSLESEYVSFLMSSNDISTESQTFSGISSNAQSILVLGLAHLPVSLLLSQVLQFTFFKLLASTFSSSLE